MWQITKCVLCFSYENFYAEKVQKYRGKRSILYFCEVKIMKINVTQCYQWRIQGVRLTRCSCKQAKILHGNALFLHKNFKKIFGEGDSSFPRLHPYPSAPITNFWIPH